MFVRDSAADMRSGVWRSHAGALPRGHARTPKVRFVVAETEGCPLADVFISHAEADGRIAAALGVALREQGFSTWSYEESGLPGISYLDQTATAIIDSKTFLLVISSSSIASRQVDAEVVLAFESGKIFIPLLVGLSHEGFRLAAPRWRQAIGSTTTIRVPDEGLEAILPRILRALDALKVEPSLPRPRPAETPAPTVPVADEAPPVSADAAPTQHMPASAPAGLPISPRTFVALVVLIVVPALVAWQVFQLMRKAERNSQAMSDSGMVTETVVPESAAAWTGRASAAPDEPVAATTPAAPPTTSAGDRPTANPPHESPTANPAKPASAQADAAPASGILVITRPFQPARFVVDGELHSQDVGSVALRYLSAGEHTIHVEDSRARGVTITVTVDAAPFKEVVALLPGFENVGDLEVALNGAEAARLYVDGTQYPHLAPCLVRGLAPGTHRVRAFNPKTRETTEANDVVVQADRSVRLDLNFRQ